MHVAAEESRVPAAGQAGDASAADLRHQCGQALGCALIDFSELESTVTRYLPLTHTNPR